MCPLLGNLRILPCAVVQGQERRKAHAPQGGLIDLLLKGAVFRRAGVHLPQNGPFIGRAGHDLPRHRSKISGGQVLQKLVTICKLETTAGIFIGKLLPQMLDPRDLLGSEIELKSVWIMFR